MPSRPALTQTYFAPQPDDDSSTMASIPPREGFVALRMRSETGSEIVEIDQPAAVVGRHSEADVRIVGPDVSRRHCELFFENGLWHVRDLSSLNGVFVNEAPVRGVAAVHLGDRLRLGTTTFIIERAAVRSPKMGALKSIARAISG